MNLHPTSTEMGWGRETTPLPQTPSPKTELGRLHKSLDTPEMNKLLYDAIFIDEGQDFEPEEFQ